MIDVFLLTYLQIEKNIASVLDLRDEFVPNFKLDPRMSAGECFVDFRSLLSFDILSSYIFNRSVVDKLLDLCHVERCNYFQISQVTGNGAGDFVFGLT